MANSTHLSMLKRSVSEWNQWKNDNPGVGVDLSEATLSGMNLSGADLSGADLREADLRGTDLSEATLSGADLREANLSRANLRKTDLSRAYLSGAYLSRATLSGADLSRANLQRAYLSGATLSGADLSGADLSGANLSGATLREAHLSGADLSGADLSEADLSGAIGLPKAPYIPALSAHILAVVEAAPHSFDMGIWHNKCNTAHCLAGHIVFAGGEEAIQLENRYGTALAAALICGVSEPDQRVPNFYSTNDKALTALRERAAETRRKEEKQDEVHAL